MSKTTDCFTAKLSDIGTIKSIPDDVMTVLKKMLIPEVESRIKINKAKGEFETMLQKYCQESQFQ